jgi:hypothetical protein
MRRSLLLAVSLSILLSLPVATLAALLISLLAGHSGGALSAPAPVVYSLAAVMLTSLICCAVTWSLVMKRIHDRAPDQPAESAPVVDIDVCETCHRRRSAGVSKQILRMTRNAERLHRVETDLIRKVCEIENADAPTARLMAELQICSNRMRAQLHDLDESVDAVSPPPPAEASSPSNN